MKQQKQRKIDWKRMLKKAAEDGIKKAVELIALGIALGVAYRMIIVAVPAVAVGTVVAKVVKVKLMG